jgi:hypothetical protein
MAQSVIDGDLVVKGNFIMTAGGVAALPANSIGNAQISSTSPLDVTKAVHQLSKTYPQKHGAVVASDTGTCIHIATGAGTVNGFSAAVRVIPIGAATVTVDLLKNGVSVLTAVVTLDNATVAYTAEAAAITTPAYVAGDFFEVVVVATAGGGTLPQGLGVQATFRETAQA